MSNLGICPINITLIRFIPITQDTKPNQLIDVKNTIKMIVKGHQNDVHFNMNIGNTLKKNTIALGLVKLHKSPDKYKCFLEIFIEWISLSYDAGLFFEAQ